jgi:integral membrane sensor domain MASE1
MRYDMRRSPKTPEGLSLPGDLPTRLGVLALLTIVYVAAGKVGLGLAFVHASASAVWPPTGIALAAFLVLGNRVWPAILLGAFLVNLSTAGTVATSAAIATGNTLEGLVGAVLVRRFAGGVRAFDGVRDILRFVVSAAIVATAISATIGTTTLGAAGLAPWTAYGTIWLTWWLGDAAGALLVAPFLVLAATEPPPRWTLRRIGEAALLFGALGAVGTIVFHGVVPPSMIFLCVPFPFWAAFRFGRREAAASAILLSTIAVWGTVVGYGPFVAESPNRSLLLLQVFMGGLSVMILAVAAVVLQAQRVERELRVARDDLEDTVSARTESLRQAVKALEREVLDARAPNTSCASPRCGCAGSSKRRPTRWSSWTPPARSPRSARRSRSSSATLGARSSGVRSTCSFRTGCGHGTTSTATSFPRIRTRGPWGPISSCTRSAATTASSRWRSA